ncbi:TolA [Candidatus Blochmanniella pennsylvanica str. BPEN]|uniref:TolA n=2 Tax=Candidatus Blochmanniella pennsylvanica TaxID=101534 RepID=Q492X0_BLOPB|nr:TolA [Candidatus Blochmannia pennsylvanicus str. BPEN]
MFNRYYKKFRSAVMISIIVHVIVSLLLYKHIIKKQQQYTAKIANNKNSINTFIHNSNPKKEKNNNIKDQSNRFKITEAQPPLAGPTAPNTPKKKSQDQSNRFKITEAQPPLAGPTAPNTPKKKSQDQSNRFKITEAQPPLAGPTAPNTPKKKSQDQSNRFKITEAQPPLAGPTAPNTPKKKSQDQSNRFKITEAQPPLAGPTAPNTPKKKSQDQSNRFKITEAQPPLAGPTAPNTPKKKSQNTIEKNILIHDKLNYQSHDSNELNNLLNTLINKKKSIENNKKSKLDLTTKKNDNENNISNEMIKSNEINIYKRMISESIQQKFYNFSYYVGKQCNLRIKLAPDGTLLSVTAISGDYDLCQAAIIAAKLAKIPKPPNSDIYEIFKNTILNFSPQ